MERIKDIINVAYALGIASTVSAEANVDAASAVVSLEALVDEDDEDDEDIGEYLRRLEEEAEEEEEEEDEEEASSTVDEFAKSHPLYGPSTD